MGSCPDLLVEVGGGERQSTRAPEAFPLLGEAINII